MIINGVFLPKEEEKGTFCLRKAGKNQSFNIKLILFYMKKVAFMILIVWLLMLSPACLSAQTKSWSYPKETLAERQGVRSHYQF